MVERHVTWILNPSSLGPDPYGICWGLGICDGVFTVSRAELDADPVRTGFDSLDAALDQLPGDIAAFVRYHGTDIVAWAVGLDEEGHAQPRT